MLIAWLACSASFKLFVHKLQSVVLLKKRAKREREKQRTSSREMTPNGNGSCCLRSQDFSSQIQHVEKMNRRETRAASSCFRLLLPILCIAFASFGTQFGTHPPPPKICGTLHGPPVTAKSFKLPDGRPLAYAEWGVPLPAAKHKLLIVHDYGSFRLDISPLSQQSLEELGVYAVSYDRPGYGESHPFPQRSIESEVNDIEHLADKLNLGPKLHLVTIGLGSYAGWGCLRYVPHRLASVGFVAPVANFWWPSWNSSSKSFQRLGRSERKILRVAHYLPSMLHLLTQSSSITTMERLSRSSKVWEQAVQQGVHESLQRDLMLQFGRWKFDPASMKWPLELSNVSVQVWCSSSSSSQQDDSFFPPPVQRHLKGALPWIKFNAVAAGKRSLLEHVSSATLLTALLLNATSSPSL